MIEEGLAGVRHVHLVGIGGSGMSAIARVLLERGYVVSGSDVHASDLFDDLAHAGATLYVGHAGGQIAGADVVVISSAIPADNPELQAARVVGVPVLKRADFLGRLMAGSYGIAVAGTHGKTTTTSMIAQILLDAGLDPTVIVGGVMPGLGTNARAGRGPHFVIEADEYDSMFLGLRYVVAVINNIEHDHPDIFTSEAAYMAAFRAFAAQVPADGHLVLSHDDAETMALLRELQPACAVTTIGLGPQADLYAEQIRPNRNGGSDFVVMQGDRLVGLARLRVPGRHNVHNALAALAVTQMLGVPFVQAAATLAEFGGVGRRFQEIGNVAGVTVIDDYAHHPTEIRVTLAAARQRYPGRTVWAVWQPHTYSRTRLLFDSFVQAFDEADKVIVLDIYRSRERDTLGIDAGQVVAAMTGTHHYVRHVGQIEAAAAYILDRVRPDDVILTLGAGDGNRVGVLVLDGLRRRLNPAQLNGSSEAGKDEER